MSEQGTRGAFGRNVKTYRIIAGLNLKKLARMVDIEVELLREDRRRSVSSEP